MTSRPTSPVGSPRLLCAVIQVAAKAVQPLRAMQAAKDVFLNVVMRSGVDDEFGVTLFRSPPPTELRIADYQPTLHHEFVVATVEIRSTEEAFEAWGWGLVRDEEWDALENRMVRVVAEEEQAV